MIHSVGMMFIIMIYFTSYTHTEEEEEEDSVTNQLKKIARSRGMFCSSLDNRFQVPLTS